METVQWAGVGDQSQGNVVAIRRPRSRKQRSRHVARSPTSKAPISVGKTVRPLVTVSHYKCHDPPLTSGTDGCNFKLSTTENIRLLSANNFSIKLQNNAFSRKLNLLTNIYYLSVSTKRACLRLQKTTMANGFFSSHHSAAVAI